MFLSFFKLAVICGSPKRRHFWSENKWHTQLCSQVTQRKWVPMICVSALVMGDQNLFVVQWFSCARPQRNMWLCPFHFWLSMGMQERVSVLDGNSCVWVLFCLVKCVFIYLNSCGLCTNSGYVLIALLRKSVKFCVIKQLFVKSCT